ncbi:MAG: molybdopterin molybdotransferase MoeA [Hyphomicrobiales bacterium]|nr:molybdopterin molybdotransferase MoeA [Hyphomicrobiales bacterium]
MSVAEALQRVLDGVAPLPAYTASLEEAHGCVLADDLAARRTQPPEDVSAMDGYAVRGEDVASAPAHLKVIGEVAAGHPFAGKVGPGEAARIFTGGVLPPGADTVVMQEDTTREADTVVVAVPSPCGRHIRRAGLDFKTGEVLLTKGTRLSARALALAAAMNHPTMPVHHAPKVAVLATGDELVRPGTEPGFGEIVYSNGYATMALARSEGCAVVDLGIAPDRLEETVAAVRRARESGAHLLVTSGGASVGEYDLVQQALAAEGLALSFWRVALRPGRPMMHGRLGDMHVLGLPGNPVSAFVCSVLFLIPLIRRLAGYLEVEPLLETAVLGCDLPQNGDRADYLRASLTPGPQGPVVTPFPDQDSSLLVPLSRAGCLLVREPFAAAARAGSFCSILKLGR